MDLTEALDYGIAGVALSILAYVVVRQIRTNKELVTAHQETVKQSNDREDKRVRSYNATLVKLYDRHKEERSEIARFNREQTEKTNQVIKQQAETTNAVVSRLEETIRDCIGKGPR